MRRNIPTRPTPGANPWRTSRSTTPPRVPSTPQRAPTPVVFPNRPPDRVEEQAGAPGEQTERLWRLVLIDDDDHSYEYVIEMLGAVFGYGREKAFALACIVDTDGRVTLMTGERAACEAKQGQVHAYGADPRIPRCAGSMTAIVEQADVPFA